MKLIALLALVIVSFAQAGTTYKPQVEYSAVSGGAGSIPIATNVNRTFLEIHTTQPITIKYLGIPASAADGIPVTASTPYVRHWPAVNSIGIRSFGGPSAAVIIYEGQGVKEVKAK